METRSCSFCGGGKEVYRNRKTGRLMCSSCQKKARYWDPSNFKPCDVCHKSKRGCRRDKLSGQLVCHNCHIKDPSKNENCSVCGRSGLVAVRDEFRRPVCSSCRRKNPAIYERCSVCGFTKLPKSRNESGGAICGMCYQRSKTGRCVGCGEKKVIQAKRRCYCCYQRQRRRRQRIKLVA